MKPALLLGGAALFVILATANAGGYRYGVSDQTYYAAAVLKARTPSLFPRDGVVLGAESSLMATDKILAGASRALHLDLPVLFAIVQLLTLAGLAAAAAAFARALGASAWTVALFLALLTLRHHIAKTGANTLEGYMHPRVIAFALGLAALACVLRGRPWLLLLCLAAAMVAHPTTAAWFAIAATAAAFVSRPAWRVPLVAIVIAGALAGIWMVAAGPLAGRFVRMDPPWLAVLADRDYLFPSRWPAYAWAINLGYLLVILIAWRVRRRRGEAVPAEAGLVAGCLALVAVFLLALPFDAANVALAIQLQVDRVFWLLDVIATAYIAWWILSGPLGASTVRRAATLAVVLALSAARGAYVLHQGDGRPLVAITLPDTPWTEAMRWIRDQPGAWNVLADPGHAFRFGPSVRVAAERDTVLEISKDPAIAMYDRSLALRTADRERALEHFGEFDTAEVRRVGRDFAADVAVMPRSQPLDLPVLYSNAGFVVYDLR